MQATDDSCSDHRCHHHSLVASVSTMKQKLKDKFHHHDEEGRTHRKHRILKKHWNQQEWTNWNNNQTCSRATLHHPTNLDEIIGIVKTSDKVRVAGYGHSWSPIVATEDDAAFSLIDLKECYQLKKILSTPEQVRATNAVTFQCATSIQDLEDWLRREDIPMTLPANVVLTEVFLVGLTACVCHGAGYDWGTVSDFVRSITLVDAKGEIITYTDQDPRSLPLSEELLTRSRVEVVTPEVMNHVRGSFGLFGVIYAMTMSLVPADIICMRDRLEPVETLLDPVKLKELVEKYNGWLEIFWVPFNDNIWLKTWEIAKEGTKRDKPHHHTSDMVLGRAGRLMYDLRPGRHLSEDKRHKFGKVYLHKVFKMMSVEFSKKPIVHHYHRYDATHYRDYIDNFPVEDTEFSLPVDDDYVNAANGFRVLKETIEDIEAKDALYPVNLTCEMRFTRGTKVSMSQHPHETSNKWVHMEFLRSSLSGLEDSALEKSWLEAVHRITGKWIEMGGLPHWAKGWHLIPGIDELLKKKVIRKNFVEFRRTVDPNGKFLSHKFSQLLENGPVSGGERFGEFSASTESTRGHTTSNGHAVQDVEAQKMREAAAMAGHSASLHGNTAPEVLRSLQEMRIAQTR
ncbi:hypothetical protein PROFUN_09142 [Planoprotostelium fungivorum]|uniref:FAD-binding PCMH-type domain-containing protein n=1 Tax=Planoprotostelium fungivorum TaxID=1890364 RepID=A0A2P6MVH4_9EUKA|nr:hypothetical protein PROFUN_09142 [Planoprotostelium fungivorum]